MEISAAKQHTTNGAISNCQSIAAYLLTALFLVATIVLSLISLAGLCTTSCLESHNYRLYGFTFEFVGLLFFPVLLLSHLLSRPLAICGVVTGWLLSAALGSELLFIYMQKYVIGSWCPLCLSIASALAIAGAIYFAGYLYGLKSAIKKGDRSMIVNQSFNGFAGIVAFVVGFILAFSGVGKNSELQAEENTIKHEIVFGNPSSPVDVFIFTDWSCPACRSLEATFEKISPVIMKSAKLTFVDDPVHEITLNYTPYNLSFMVHNKAQYFALRHALTRLSEETKEPTETQIKSLARSVGANFTELHYGAIAMGSKYFESLIAEYKVEGTPTVVIANSQTKKTKKLEGITEINEENILKAIDTLSK